MKVTVERADLASPEFADLVTAHTLFCDGTAPPESCHRLPLAALSAEDVTVWQACGDGKVIGMGALKSLSPSSGEVKSMHTLKGSRGSGAGRRILETILEEAKSRHYDSLWLETGVHSDFASAHKLYRTYGFTEVGPFGSYELDPHSMFMCLKLSDMEEV